MADLLVYDCGCVEECRCMVHCDGCGFNVEREDVRETGESWDRNCSRCRKCTEVPALRESYRRGFNAGLDAMREAVVRIAEKSNLRKATPQTGKEP